MKRSLIIYCLFLSASFILGSSIQAQQQKKPSERSFTSELIKIKQIQAARNTTIREIQQPTDSTRVLATDNKSENEKEKPASNTNSNTVKDSRQQNVTTKPSSGVMRQARKPAASKG
jgi:hypothetical protein